jgi:pimeloyl-ACP methyl ester carboxylesterase
VLYFLKKQMFHHEKTTMPTDHANDTTIQLRDGRTLGYAEYGMRDGKALFYFHGHPGSRLEARLLAEQAKHSGIRLIGIDRPGMGLSCFQAGRHLLDWPLDVVELANSLHLDRFAVVGFSGGGPYALACAYRIPQRLTACGIIAGVGHTSRFRSFLSLWLPWLLLPIARRFFRNEVLSRRRSSLLDR